MVNTVIKNEYRKKITVFVTMNEYIKKKIWKYFQKKKGASTLLSFLQINPADCNSSVHPDSHKAGLICLSETC